MQVGLKRSHETATPILPLRNSPVKLDDMKSCYRRLIEEMQFPEQLAESQAASEQGLDLNNGVRVINLNFLPAV